MCTKGIFEKFRHGRFPNPFPNIVRGDGVFHGLAGKPTVLLHDRKTTFSTGCTHQPIVKVRVRVRVKFSAPLRSRLFSSRAFHRFSPLSSRLRHPAIFFTIYM